VESILGADAFAQDLDAPDAEAQRLDDAGFVSFTVQQMGPDEGPGAGISNVELYETEDGASTSAEYRLAHLEDEVPDPKADLQPFEVPGVPESGGWTAKVRPDPVANIVWVEGRCVMTLGNQGPGDLVKPLTAAVQAVHERVKGQCP
jgi:hypothetical protein